jgi:lipoate-protein ligase A
MHTEITHKIPHGKLVRISLDYDTTILQDIKICGDFFIHPEETVEEMERALFHLPVEATESRIKGLLDRAVHQKNAQLIGVDTQSVAKLIHEAIWQ